jgi:hypothetical protein
MNFDDILSEKKKKKTKTASFDGIIRRPIFVPVVKEDSSMGSSDVAYSTLVAPFLGVSKDRSEFDYKKKKRNSKKDKNIVRPVKEDCDTDTPVADKLKIAKPDIIWGKDVKRRKKHIIKRVSEASYDTPRSLASVEGEASKGYKPGVMTDKEIRKLQLNLGKSAENTQMRKKKRTIQKMTKGMDVGKWDVYEQMVPPAPVSSAPPPGTTSGGGMSAKDVVGMPRDLGRDALKRKKKRRKLTMPSYSSKI